MSNRYNKNTGLLNRPKVCLSKPKPHFGTENPPTTYCNWQVTAIVIKASTIISLQFKGGTDLIPVLAPQPTLRTATAGAWLSQPPTPNKGGAYANFQAPAAPGTIQLTAKISFTNGDVCQKTVAATIIP